METTREPPERLTSSSRYTCLSDLWEISAVAEVGILVIEDDAVSQGAIKSVLDAEGWRVRVLSTPEQLFAELASGCWSLVIVNVSLLDFDGPLFSILKDLTQAEVIPAEKSPQVATPSRAGRAANRQGRANQPERAARPLSCSDVRWPASPVAARTGRTPLHFKALSSA